MIPLSGAYAPAGPWSRNKSPFTVLISFPFLDYSEDIVIFAPWKAFQITRRGAPHTGFVSVAAS